MARRPRSILPQLWRLLWCPPVPLCRRFVLLPVTPGCITLYVVLKHSCQQHSLPALSTIDFTWRWYPSLPHSVVTRIFCSQMPRTFTFTASPTVDTIPVHILGYLMRALSISAPHQWVLFVTSSVKLVAMSMLQIECYSSSHNQTTAQVYPTYSSLMPEMHVLVHVLFCTRYPVPFSNVFLFRSHVRPVHSLKSTGRYKWFVLSM